MLTFQEIITRLSSFWEKQGCILQQGHDLEMGAGTFNPATFLRCLGPEPYNTAYAEPCRRPKDGRYGENPNRVHLFHQYQVIIKPSPLNIQDVYLDSLAAIDIKLKEHDIRFVHDDWEGPTLGAWGLGWEVWMDGMEISQFTYFQAMGSIPVHPVSVELTYGLERLAMYVQNVSSIYDVRWNDKFTIGELSKRNEVEWSTYNFEKASIEMWLSHFNDFEKECKMLIQAGLSIPAYDFVLKASHAFNLLDARGAISVTERTGYIARIRDLARLIAEKYIESREKLGFPLLEKKTTEKNTTAPIKAPSFDPKNKRDYLLEIGSEELPASFVPIGMEDLERKVKQLLQEYGLVHDGLETFGGPRRIGIKVLNLSEGIEDSSVEKRGPALASAFDSNGKPTQQGAGFLNSCGITHAPTLADIQKGNTPLQIQDIKGVDYLFAKVEKKGVSTFAILAEKLPKIIAELSFPKKMRWSDLEVTYARPIHWMVSLFGKEVVPFSYGNIEADRYTFGHRQLSNNKISLSDPSNYQSKLKESFVLVSPKERKETMLKQIRELEKTHNVKVVSEERVLTQVLNLSEWPQCTIAMFDSSFLRAPKEVLISEMIEHQKYFPVADEKGNLKNEFIITADNNPSDIIRMGNQRVLSARLSDGVFLYEQDSKIPLERFNEKLKNMTFQKDLGSMWQKVMRIEKIAHFLQETLKIGDQKMVARASLLCKADLASTMVGEFPELQGIIGGYYAVSQKEEKEVSSAIREHWLPNQENGPLPKTPTGIVVSLADKMDNILGYYSVGLKPSSSSDPYALRRQMMGICKIAIENKISLPLHAVLEKAALFFPGLQDHSHRNQIVQEILVFIKNRLKTVLEEKGLAKDGIEATLSKATLDPYDNYSQALALEQFRTSEEFHKLCEVYKRAKGQLENMDPVALDLSLGREPSEIALGKQIGQVDPVFANHLENKNYLEGFRCLATLQKPLSDLFEKVKILDDNIDLRNHRISLLQRIFTYFDALLDFNKIQMR